MAIERQGGNVMTTPASDDAKAKQEERAEDQQAQADAWETELAEFDPETPLDDDPGA